MAAWVSHQRLDNGDIQLRWPDVQQLLGRPYRGDDDDSRLVEYLRRDAGLPEWIEEAEGYQDPLGWYLKSPVQFDRAAFMAWLGKVAKRRWCRTQWPTKPASCSPKRSIAAGHRATSSPGRSVAPARCASTSRSGSRAAVTRHHSPRPSLIHVACSVGQRAEPLHRPRLRLCRLDLAIPRRRRRGQRTDQRGRRRRDLIHRPLKGSFVRL